MRVLLVDDDRIFNFISKKTMEHIEGISEIEVRNNGQDALNFIQECIAHSHPLPDLIFLDLNMPIMDGFEFIEAFRRVDNEQFAKVLIAIVTSSLNPKDISRAKELGVNHYISKPISEHVVIQIMGDRTKAGITT